ncbi:MAG: hypothetical protein M1827_003436 [Pycnora praestabilis]|nr:MAG: hypothetical protein M1827_003436 [Pycnora praestabilis]
MADASDSANGLDSLFANLRKPAATSGSNRVISSSDTITQNSNQQHFDQNQSRSTPSSSNQTQQFFPFPQLSNSPSQLHGYHQPSVSSPLSSPSPSGPQPSHSSVMSSNVRTPNTQTPVPAMGQSNADRTASLLDLLKFTQPGTLPSSTPAATQSRQEGIQNTLRSSYGVLENSQPYMKSNDSRTVSASDLVASFRGKGSDLAVSRSIGNTASSNKPDPTLSDSPGPIPENPQDFLLRLLNRPKPAYNELSSDQQNGEKPAPIERQVPELAVEATTRDLMEASLGGRTPNQNDSSVHIFGSDENIPPTPFQLEQPPSNSTIFTYSNPFDQLAVSSPRKKAPKADITPRADTPRSGTRTPTTVLKTARNTPEGTNGENKRKTKETSPGPSQLASRRKLVSSGDETLIEAGSPSPAPRADGRSDLEALMGIGSEAKNAKKVSQALSEIGGQVDRQVEQALAKAERREVENMKQEAKDVPELMQKQKPECETLEAANDASIDDKTLLEETSPKLVAEVVKETIDDVGQANVADSWESADGEDNSIKNEEARDIRVYNFPLRPFVSIDIEGNREVASGLREDAIMDIARLKKDFDQVDRTLATSTSSYIVYAMSKSGGFRVIRQDDGKDKQIFRTTQDRIFNLSIATAAAGSSSAGTETVLGTGMSGSVYWAMIAQPSADFFDEENIERQGLILPPVPALDDNTSGGQLKTRAKKSCRHPELFAVGRGRSINLIWPLAARSRTYMKDEKTRLVDTEKYFKERSLKITTGKAGKDFAFSEDDSLILSLDKAGRLKFWDIRDLVNEATQTSKQVISVEVKDPIMTLVTTSPTEKSWPTSVLFVDKLRPYSRGTALRYVIVGMKQNHTLQLWDLGLGRAVQELNFPHEKESDAFCSVAYHPTTGIIVLGHPTRNSIYFVHLSAPKYNIPAMAQAKYVQRLAEKDPSLPKPEATAIMSGLREYSFDFKGQLRSLDMLPTPHISAAKEDLEDPVLFELYAMHSRGVTCLSIKREDLGWNKDSKVLHPVDAEVEGLIIVADLREPVSVAPTEPLSSTNGDQIGENSVTNSASTPKTVTKDTVRKAGMGDVRTNQAQTPEAALIATGVAKVENKDDESRAATMNGNHDTAKNVSEKGEKKKKKKAVGGDVSSFATNELIDSSVAVNAQSKYVDVPTGSPQPLAFRSTKSDPRPPVASEGPGIIVPSNESLQTKLLANGDPIIVGKSGDSGDEEFRKIERGFSTEFSKIITQELGALYRRFDEDKRVQDAAGAAKQDAILRLVSSTLSENVEKSLARMIGTNIQQVVLPSIADVTVSSLDRKLSEVVSQQIDHSIPQELKHALPNAISRTMQEPEVLRTISDLVANKVATHVEGEFSAVLHSTISPAFKNLAVGAAQKMSAEVERRVGEQLQQADVHRHNDSLKIDQLTDLVRGLSETVHTMAAAQSDFQHEILKLQRQLAQTRQEESSMAASRQQQRPSSVRTEMPVLLQKTPEQEELDSITTLMTEGRYEEGTIKWLQSTQQADLFTSFFVRCSPAYIETLSPLVALSVSAAVTSSLEGYIMERLNWLEAVFATINPRDPDIIEVAPRIMDVLSQRLEGLYMRIAEIDPHDPVLRKIPPLTRQAKELKSLGM